MHNAPVSGAPPVHDNVFGEALATLLIGLGGLDVHRDVRKVVNQFDRVGYPGPLAGIRASLQEREPQQFCHTFLQPLELLVEDMVTKHLGFDSDAAFLFTNASFVENHLNHLFATFEGTPFSSDKASWAMRRLARHLLDGTPIVADLSQPYVFHLPDSILNTQAELVDMYVSLRLLHGGRPDRYLKALATTAQKCAARDFAASTPRTAPAGDADTLPSPAAL